MMEYLKIKNWHRWQSYRKDRGQPPWIKLHREVMRNPEWVSLTDSERGQLVAIWLLAADRDGVIPASVSMIKKLCYMGSEPNLELYVALGFIERDANVTPTWRQDDVNVTPTWRQRDANMTPQSREEKRREEKRRKEGGTRAREAGDKSGIIPTATAGKDSDSHPFFGPTKTQDEMIKTMAAERGFDVDAVASGIGTGRISKADVDSAVAWLRQRPRTSPQDVAVKARNDSLRWLLVELEERFSRDGPELAKHWIAENDHDKNIRQKLVDRWHDLKGGEVIQTSESQ